MMSDFSEIEFTISKDGTVEYVIKGIKGSSCEDVAALFESLGDVQHAKNTTEYYDKPVASSQPVVSNRR